MNDLNLSRGRGIYFFAILALGGALEQLLGWGRAGDIALVVGVILQWMIVSKYLRSSIMFERLSVWTSIGLACVFLLLVFVELELNRRVPQLVSPPAGSLTILGLTLWLLDRRHRANGLGLAVAAIGFLSIDILARGHTFSGAVAFAFAALALFVSGQVEHMQLVFHERQSRPAAAE